MAQLTTDPKKIKAVCTAIWFSLLVFVGTRQALVYRKPDAKEKAEQTEYHYCNCFLVTLEILTLFNK